MSWDDPLEPTEEEMEEYEAEQAVKNAPSVRIEGVTAEAVAIIIRETVRREFRLKETAEAAVKEAVEAAVREAIEGKLLGLTEEHLRPEGSAAIYRSRIGSASTWPVVATATARWSGSSKKSWSGQ